MIAPKPWLADNGLRVKTRTCRSITLIWSTEDEEIHSDSSSEASPNASLTAVSSRASERSCIESSVDDQPPWFEVQMKPSNSDSWTTVYKGYSTSCQVNDLLADASVNFRLKKSTSNWGTNIIAATDASPPSAEDLQRAVYCNAEEMTTRILGTVRATHLKKLLLSHDRTGLTPLMIAAQNGNNIIIQMLVRAGAKVNSSSLGARKTPLMLAVANGHLHTCQLLDRLNADWFCVDKTGCNVLHYAVSQGSIKIVSYVLDRVGDRFLEERDDCGWPPLMRAVIVGTSAEVVKELLQRGANPNATDANNTKSCLMAAMLLEKQAIANELVAANADTNYCNSNGTHIQTLLKSAAK